ncbi:UNVERIFIED_CONTAM: hypothetical protein HDU68_003184 [Siphonaria sp. JEL0065]|nr:hypothetical protein HDU68_003184 [Siphonaria sp. JEL0065]
MSASPMWDRFIHVVVVWLLLTQAVGVKLVSRIVIVWTEGVFDLRVLSLLLARNNIASSGVVDSVNHTGNNLASNGGIVPTIRIHPKKRTKFVKGVAVVYRASGYLSEWIAATCLVHHENDRVLIMLIGGDQTPANGFAVEKECWRIDIESGNPMRVLINTMDGSRQKLLIDFDALEKIIWFEGRTFNIFEFFDLIRLLGGFRNVVSWTDLCRKVNMNPAKSNISTRLREWAEKHHIVAFFDFLLGIENHFYRDLRDEDEIIGNILIEKEGFDERAPESDQEMWLRLYGLDGGLTTRKKIKPVVVAPTPIANPSTTTPFIASGTPQLHTTNNDTTSTSKRSRDSLAEDSSAATKRRRLEGDRIVIIGGIPYAALCIQDQKVLNDVNEKIKYFGISSSASVSTDAKNISTGNTMFSTSHPGFLLIPSAQPRLDSLRASLEGLKGSCAVTGSVSGAVDTVIPAVDLSEAERLKVEVSSLVDLLKSQQGIIENLRKRVAALDE